MRALLLTLLPSLAGCESVSGLAELEFVAEACVPESLDVSCDGIACGDAVDNCGATVSCPDTCPGAFACEVGGVGPNTCGCTGGAMQTPPAPSECALVGGDAGHSYYFCGGGGFDEARAFCRGFGTDLVVLADQAENDFVAQQMPANSYLGLVDPEDCVSGTCAFAWVDDSALSFANWNFGEPNNTGGGEHCVELQKSTGRWNDIPCTNTLGIACETTCP